MEIASSIILFTFISCVLLCCASFFRVYDSPVDAIHASFVVIASVILVCVLGANVISDCALCIRYCVFAGPALDLPVY